MTVGETPTILASGTQAFPHSNNPTLDSLWDYEDDPADKLFFKVTAISGAIRRETRQRK
jgi:hypothetical protein